MAQALPAQIHIALSQALQQQQAQDRLSRGSGLWVIVPLHYAQPGSPPIEVWLDHCLSKTLKMPCDVALLGAVETFGSWPFAVIATHVVVPKARRSVFVGRCLLDFIRSNHVDGTPKQ